MSASRWNISFGETLKLRPVGCNTQEHCVFCSYTPVMYKPPQQAFLLTFQEVTPLSKTRNQLMEMVRGALGQCRCHLTGSQCMSTVAIPMLERGG